MRYLFAICAVVSLLVPAQLFAQSSGIGNLTQPRPDSGPGAPALFNQSTGDSSNCGSGGGVQICNPLKAQSITEFFTQLIEILLIFAVPIIVFFIILAGFKFVTAQGNQNTLGDAKRALLYAIVGGLLILGAFLVLNVIQATVGAFTV